MVSVRSRVHSCRPAMGRQHCTAHRSLSTRLDGQLYVIFCSRSALGTPRCAARQQLSRWCLMPILTIVSYAGYRVVAVDMPGHGRSQHLPACCGHYSAEAHIRICAALLGQSPSCSLFTPDLFNRSAQHFSGNSDFPPQILLIGHR